MYRDERYSNRWSVETLIQEGRSVFGLADITVRRKTAIECFLLASGLMVLLSRYLLRQIRAGLPVARGKLVEVRLQCHAVLYVSVSNPLQEDGQNRR